MQHIIISAIIVAMSILFTGCRFNIGGLDPATGTGSDSSIVVTSITARPAKVSVNESSLILCSAKSSTGSPLTFEWDATGAVGSLSGKDSVCVFRSPSCHYGPSTVTVTITDASGAKTTAVVELNAPEPLP